MIEEWKEHPTKNLIISSKGRVKKPNGKIQKTYIDAKGYAHSCSQKVHRLVAEAFIPNPALKPEVNHKDSDRANNDVANLEWVTRQENMAHSVEQRRLKKGTPPPFLSDLERNERMKILKSLNWTVDEIAKEIGVHRTTVMRNY